MLLSEKAFIKRRYAEDDFTLKGFFSTYGYRTPESGLPSLRAILFELTSLVKPKGINAWAEDIMNRLDELMNTEEMQQYWNTCRQEDSLRRTRESEQLGDDVYLSTRKRTYDKSFSENLPESSTSAKGKEPEDFAAEISFLSTSTDTEYMNISTGSDAVTYRRYILCFDELTKAKSARIQDDEIKQYDANLLGIDDVLLLSGIIQKEDEVYPIYNLLAEDQEIVQTWIRTFPRKAPFDLLPKSAQQMVLTSHLLIMHRNIITEMPGLISLISNEEEFKLKHVFPLLQLVFHDLTVRCDVASRAYANTDTSMFATIRPDFLVSDGQTELVVIEVKPFNSATALVDADEIRVAELTKKILHLRMARAKDTKEFCSFGITVAGENMNMYRHNFKDGEYTYTKVCRATLPTMSHTYSLMSVTLEALLAFKQIIQSTLPTEEDLLKPYMFNVTNNMKPTTLYRL